jgi:exodeoxyribonuclease VII large subunit
LQPRLVRQRYGELRERLANLERHGAGGLVKTVDRARLKFAPCSRQLPIAVATSLERKQTVLGRLAPRLSAQPLRAELRHAHSRLAPLAGQLAQAGSQLTANRRQNLEQLGKLMDTLSYRNVLARGYAIVQDSQGQVVTDAVTLAPGDALHIILGEGSVDAAVGGAPVRRKGGKSTPDDGSQESLF